MTMTLRLLESQAAQLRELLLRDENESAALALCGRSSVPDPWSGGADERFIIQDVIEVPAEAYLSRSPTDFTWSTKPFYDALKRAERRGLAVAVFHSHPAGCLVFSKRDDVAEHDLFEIAFNRLESRRPHLSVVMDGNGHLVARAYGPDLKPRAVESIAVIGERWTFYPRPDAGASSAEFDRQARAFGAASTADLARLRIGIVGCGGTGSAVAMLLGRIGVRNFVLLDRDRVEATNLNRLHFSTRPDASLRRRKVDVVGGGLAALGLPMTIVRHPDYGDTPEGLELLRSCDVIFGCTDDHLGRTVLNRLAHFYFIPVIDLGLLIEPGVDGGYDTFDGRVTVVQPGYPCQTCRGLIDGDQRTLDSLRRDPALLEERRRAGYVPDDPDPSPVVVTFSTEVATMAVNELFHRLNGFRGPQERCSERIRRFDYLKDADTLAGGIAKPQCKLCGKRQYDGRGDMNPLLDLTL